MASWFKFGANRLSEDKGNIIVLKTARTYASHLTSLSFAPRHHAMQAETSVAHIPECPRIDHLERIRLLRHVHDMLLDEVLAVLEQERDGNIQGYNAAKLTPVDTSLELKLLELKFRVAVTTSITLVALIWMIILAAHSIFDGNDLAFCDGTSDVVTVLNVSI